MKEKACLNCKRIYTEQKCPNCGETQFTNVFKGEVEIFEPEKSIVAKKLNINSKGKFAIKIK
ncbi:MAG: transcription elongation factor subunit Spt4 [Candidatus Pacearchaeota archaeon]